MAVVALASSFHVERYEAGMQALRRLGFEPVPGAHVLEKTRPYFAATPEQRLADLHQAFADPAIAAIFCVRGGYGTNYLLDGVDLDLIRQHPKPLFAYSDMTCLQTWLLDQTGLVAFHGPMVAADFALPLGVDMPSFMAATGGYAYEAGTSEGLRVLQPGRASGVLYGGCLTLLTASLGTPYAAQTEGKLLFLEDVGTKPFQVDRMIRQLRLADKLEGVPGIIFGEMLDCVSPGADKKLIEEAILSSLEGFAGPIAIGLRSGHVSSANVTLTFGVEAELQLEHAPSLRVREPATHAAHASTKERG